MTPQEIVEARAPEYEGEPRIADLLELAEEETGSAYGTLRNKAVALLVLHWLTKDKRGGASGPIQSESEGQLSRSYGSSSNVEGGDLSSTSYGAELLNLRRGSFMAARNRMM